MNQIQVEAANGLLFQVLFIYRNLTQGIRLENYNREYLSSLFHNNLPLVMITHGWMKDAFSLSVVNIVNRR